MPVVLLGGTYGGVMTPTEAAAVAAAYTFLIAVLWYSNVTARETYLAALNSSRSTAAIGMLSAGTLVFYYVGRDLPAVCLTHARPSTHATHVDRSCRAQRQDV